jgi:hypothetical protein
MTTPPRADAFYLPLGDGRFAPTVHTGGPWDPTLQHAGPPSALLARALEQAAAPWPSTITRVTVDLLGPVPVADLDLHVEVLRSGRSVELVQASLANDGRVAARATAWRVRRADLELPPLPDDHDQPAGTEVPAIPGTETALPPGFGGGYLQAMEWREARGSWGSPGAAAVWGRMRLPLIPDEEPSGLQRIMAIADSGNGVSSVLPLESWFFINPDLTVHLAAEPAGEWICLDAHTRVDAAGFGLAASRLFDSERLVARGAQTLYIGPR